MVLECTTKYIITRGVLLKVLLPKALKYHLCFPFLFFSKKLECMHRNDWIN